MESIHNKLVEGKFVETKSVKTDQITWKPWFEIIEDAMAERKSETTTVPFDEQSRENQTQFKRPSWQYFTYYIELWSFLLTPYEPPFFLDYDFTMNFLNASINARQPASPSVWVYHSHLTQHSWETFRYETFRFLEKTNQLKALTEKLLDSLEAQNLTVPKRFEVSEYIADHPDLQDVLPDICMGVVEEFSKDAKISLELYSDPEIDYRYLTIYIRQQKYEDQILERIRRVREKYTSKLLGKKGRILITTDFNDPI